MGRRLVVENAPSHLRTRDRRRGRCLSRHRAPEPCPARWWQSLPQVAGQHHARCALRRPGQRPHPARQGQLLRDPCSELCLLRLINSVLEAAAKYKSPVMIQFSNGGSQYYAGKSVESPKDTLKGCVLGAIAGALHTKQMAEHYGVPVILHSDHCAKKLLPWFDGMLEADEKHFKEHGTPLFSSHMLDLSEEPHEENIATCAEYLKRMAKIDCLLEMEIGITGGEEDGVNNEDAKPEDLYSKPEEAMQVVEAFSKVPNAMYTIAAAFGNVHGVYKAGNVKLSPEILGAAQAHVKEKTGSKEDKPVFFVFHGGSGSEKDKIKEALNHGVVKMNIDTDIQWATWD